MKIIKKVNYEIFDIQRGEIQVEDYHLNYIPLIITGYYSLYKNTRKVSLETILNSSNIKEGIKDALRIIGEDNEFLKDALEHFSSLTLSNEKLAKIAVILKSSFFSIDQYRVAFEDMLDSISEICGKSGGESITPNFLNKLAVEIVEPKEGEFYDGVLGTGGDAIEAYKYAEKYENKLKVFGQELNKTTYALAKVRMFMNGIDSANVKLGDVLTNPEFVENKNTLKKFDSIIMCPPFGLSWKDKESTILNDKYARFIYGTPAVSSSDWLFILTALKSLKENGKAVVITTLGSLFRAGAEEELRKKIVGFDYIESIIQLPSGLFTNTAIPTAMIVINMNKNDNMKNKIQFIDASDIYEYVRRGKNILNDENINRILELYRSKSNIDELSTIVDIKDIENGNLNVSRYVIKTEFDSTNHGKVKIHLENLKTTTKFSDIANFYRGISVTSKNILDPNGNYRIINLPDVKNGELDLNSLQTYSIANNARVEAYKVEVGDIIISNKGATKICIIPEHEGDILISQNFIGIRLKGGNNPQYIKEFLESPIGEYLIEGKKTGTAVTMINPKDLKELPIVMVDKNEQNTIINSYEQEQIALKEEMKALQAKIDNLKLELYKNMKINDIFEVM